MDIDWILIIIGIIGLSAAIVQLIRWGAGFEEGNREGDQ